MSETNVTEIKSFEGHPLADERARADIAALSEEMTNLPGDGLKLKNGKLNVACGEGVVVEYQDGQWVYNTVGHTAFVESDAEYGYLDLNGNLVSYAHAKVSGYVPVHAGTKITYNLRCIAGLSCALVVYDENKVAVYKVNGSGESGTWIQPTGDYVLPENAAYIRYSMQSKSASDTVTQFITYAVEYESSGKVLSARATHWKGKKWIAFGTSITDTDYPNAETGNVTGKYVPYLAEMSGLVVNDQGIAGGTYGSGGVYGGSNSILNRVLATDVSDADLITLEGCVNDFACAVDIGGPGDVGNTTIWGAYYQAVKYCLENSNATVVLITESTGRIYTLNTTGNEANYTISKRNDIDKLQNDYNEAIRGIGKYMGVHVIDAGAESQIGEFHPEYLEDHLHHSELGGKQYAATIWDRLQTIHCNNDITVDAE